MVWAIYYLHGLYTILLCSKIALERKSRRQRQSVRSREVFLAYCTQSGREWRHGYKPHDHKKWFRAFACAKFYLRIYLVILFWPCTSLCSALQSWDQMFDTNQQRRFLTCSVPIHQKRVSRQWHPHRDMLLFCSCFIHCFIDDFFYRVMLDIILWFSWIWYFS